ncbi:MAG: hypothetical protein K6G16_06790 [Lachnospiraceae bacterium]|nr:hypothetical protein [Lachnospiraceae bacterium]
MATLGLDGMIGSIDAVLGVDSMEARMRGRANDMERHPMYKAAMFYGFADKLWCLEELKDASPLLGNLTGHQFREKMYRLYNHFEGSMSPEDGPMPADWIAEADETLRQLRGFIADVRTNYGNGKYPDKLCTELEGRGLDAKDAGYEYSRAVRERLQKDLNDGKKTDPICADIKNATTYQDFRAIIDAMRDMQHPAFSKPFVDLEIDRALKRMGEQKQLDASPMTGDQDKDFMSIVPSMSKHAIEDCLLRACSMIERDPATKAEVVAAEYDRCKTAQKSASPISAEQQQKAEMDAAEAKRMGDILPDIKGMQAKIRREEKWWHWNSSSYKKMKAAVDEVCKLADSYDPTDRQMVQEMGEKMEKLHAAAKAYADKEAYKSKSTDLGISRKNTALFLQSITEDSRKDGPSDVRENEIRDFRISGDKTARVPKNLAELIEEERRVNISTQGQVAKTAGATHKHQHKAAQKGTELGAKSANPMTPTN